jgi:hypothetical protein
VEHPQGGLLDPPFARQSCTARRADGAWLAHGAIL